ncbi:MAG: hypothetical protein DYH20_01475 [Gammaproteobacteria bacterium PRO9]|nr:hypothetical protein [Gammaproteobacteria bacterium PRO9]
MTAWPTGRPSIRIFTNPSHKLTEDQVTGRFGQDFLCGIRRLHYFHKTVTVARQTARRPLISRQTSDDEAIEV